MSLFSKTSIFVLLCVLALPGLSQDRGGECDLFEQVLSQAKTFTQSHPRLDHARLQFGEQLSNRWVHEEALAKRLVGSTHWPGLSSELKTAISGETRRTMSRYVLEAMNEWHDNPVSIVACELGDRRGYVDLSVGSVLKMLTVPVRIEMLVRRGEWRVVDISVQGIAYTRMKAGQYEQYLNEDSSGGLLLEELRRKNDAFFQDLPLAAAK